mmetsp:Transcript_26966/g.37511  ORF Transcript_26966/g.37511 Transcript_26966/m.37511 type:complete len:244 (-) Transcript_26966:239-970(-)
MLWALLYRFHAAPRDLLASRRLRRVQNTTGRARCPSALHILAFLLSLKVLRPCKVHGLVPVPDAEARFAVHLYGYYVLFDGLRYIPLVVIEEDDFRIFELHSRPILIIVEHLLDVPLFAIWHRILLKFRVVAVSPLRICGSDVQILFDEAPCFGHCIFQLKFSVLLHPMSPQRMVDQRADKILSAIRAICCLCNLLIGECDHSCVSSPMDQQIQKVYIRLRDFFGETLDLLVRMPACVDSQET